jgi:hypothetical protein
MVTLQLTQKEETMRDLFDDGCLISVYTRAQAIEDGVLVDVSEMGRESGIVAPVALTRTVWDGYVVPDAESKALGQDENGRLWDILWMMRCAIKREAGVSSEMLFEVLFMFRGKRPVKKTLKAACGPGDEGEMVITIMKPEED